MHRGRIARQQSSGEYVEVVPDERLRACFIGAVRLGRDRGACRARLGRHGARGRRARWIARLCLGVVGAPGKRRDEQGRDQSGGCGLADSAYVQWSVLVPSAPGAGRRLSGTVGARARTWEAPSRRLWMSRRRTRSGPAHRITSSRTMRQAPAFSSTIARMGVISDLFRWTSLMFRPKRVLVFLLGPQAKGLVRPRPREGHRGLDCPALGLVVTALVVGVSDER
jgi:hypothetical protein